MDDHPRGLFANIFHHHSKPAETAPTPLTTITTPGAAAAIAASAPSSSAASTSTAATTHAHGHSHTPLNPSNAPALFQLVNFPSRLVLENVYLNGLHSLRRFGIRNISDTEITVKMRSSLGSQLSFQLTNENLPFVPDATNPSTLSTLSTNTAAAAEAGSISTSGHLFNQLFNHVNHIDEVTVAPRDTVHVILGFLPDLLAKNRRSKWDSNSGALEVKSNSASRSGSTQDNGGLHLFDDHRLHQDASNSVQSGTDNGQEFDVNDQQSDNFDSFEVNGLVFFFAYKNSVQDQSQPNSRNHSPDSQSNQAQIHPSTQAPTAEDTFAASTTVAGLASTTATTPEPLDAIVNSSSTLINTPSATHRADYQHTVKFRSTVCRSVLYSNVGETGVNFDDCVANQEYVKDFTIWNKSEIPLYWQLNTVDLNNTSHEDWLRFVDYEGESFGTELEGDSTGSLSEMTGPRLHSIKTIKARPIPSYGYRRIRVIFRPRENGDFLFDLQLENLNDASNIEEATIHATVRALARGEEILLISTGHTLDFGDCGASMWTKVPMTFTNTSQDVLEIHMNADGAEVVFDLQTDPGSDAFDLAASEQIDLTQGQDGSIRSEGSGNSKNGHASSLVPMAKSRLREWVDDNPKSANGSGSPNPSVAESSGNRADRGFRDTGSMIDSGPPSPATSEPFFTDATNANVTVEQYLASQELIVNSGKDGAEDDLGSEMDASSQQESTSGIQPFVHKKRPSLRSISFSGNARDKEASQDMVRNVDAPGRTAQQTSTRIEELFLKPGTERTIMVSYCPAPDVSITNFQAGKLLRKTFRIVVTYSPWAGTSTSQQRQKDRKIIQCKARACTSFVTCEPKSLDFGDTDVGASKSLPVKLINQSEIPAIVELDFQSKVLHSSLKGSITISPKSSVELKLDIYPRKVNPDYRKQLTLRNLTNRANDQIIEVRATNIDKNRVTFHSLFYRVLYPGGTNFLEFGNVVVGGIALRTINISNFTRKWVTLEITTSLPSELSVYEQTKRLMQSADGNWNSTHAVDNHLRVSRRRTSGGKDVAKEPTDITADVGLDGPRLFMKRGDGAGTSSDPSSQPSLVSAPALASTLALKAKAILFHGDASLKEGTRPSIFLDLATNVSDAPKKQRAKLPTMKDLLQNNNVLATRHRIDRKGKAPDNFASPGAVAHGNSFQDGAKPSKDDSAAKRSETTSKTPKAGPTNGSPTGSFTDSPMNTAASSMAINDPEDPNKLESLLASMDANAMSASMLFSKPAEEEKYVKEKMYHVRELQKAISGGELVPVSMVSVPPETEYQLVIIFRPSSTFRDHIKGIPKKEDARLYLRLIDFDHDAVVSNPQFRALLDGDVSQIPLREIMVRSSLVRSTMDLGQNNINFGTLDRGEKRTKTIVIQNRSKAPLLYHIRKSGSIASGDIVLGVGKTGVVRGYGKKEVDFIFEPSLAGQYHENLAIENIQDRESSRVLSVKANIRKPKNFSIDLPEIDFGSVVEGERSACKRITVTNSTKQARSFEVRVDRQEMMPLSVDSLYGGEIEFLLEDDPQGQAVVTKEMEDEIEILEQKLKIARRKGREDKVKKVMARLSVLRKGGVEDEPPATPDSITPLPEDMTPTQERVLDFSKGEHSPATSNEINVKAIMHAVVTTTAATAAPTPVTKEVVKFKRTDHSIVFTLEAGKTKAVSAYFTPVRAPESLKIGTEDGLSSNGEVLDQERTRLQGKIYVHEHRNRDICREVSFYVSVERKDPSKEIDDQTTAVVSAKVEKNSAGSSTAKSTTKQKKEKSSSMGALDGKSFAKAEITSTQDRIPQSLSPVEETCHLPEETLSLMPTALDGGRLEQGVQGRFYFKLGNKLSTPLQYRIVLTKASKGLSLDESLIEGSLDPLEVRRINFTLSCQELRKQTRSLDVVNLLTNTTQTFSLTCLCHRSQYLAFPSLDESMELDLGHCYVDPGRKYSQVTPLLIENITDEDVYITCASNLSHQVGIFVDEQAQKGQVIQTLLKKKSKGTVWVAVQPNLLGGIAGSNSSRRIAHGTNSLSTMDRDSECRTLVGGLRFSVCVVNSEEAGSQNLKEEDYLQIFTQTVKFTSVIGRSILSVSDTLLNLGWTSEIGKPVYGAITLQNMSSRMPLDFELESQSGNIVLDRTGGTLDGWEADSKFSSEVDLASADQDGDARDQTDRSRMLITFRVTASTPGLFRDTIVVTNEHNASQQVKVEVRLFVDPSIVKTGPHGPGYTCCLSADDLTDMEETGEAPREGRRLPSLTWDDIYVAVRDDQDAPGEQRVHVLPPANNAEAVANQEYWFNVSNDSSSLLNLVPLTDSDINTRWVITTDEVEEEVGDDVTREITFPGFQACGALVQLQPLAQARLYISRPLPRMDAGEIDKLQSGQKVEQIGNILLLDQNLQGSNLVVKALSLSSQYGVSFGELSPSTLDVGKIGHYNNWVKVPFVLHLQNVSEIPLIYDIVLPQSMAFIEDVALTGQRQIPSRASIKLEGLLDPHRIDNFAIGRRSVPIQVINSNNSNNIMTCFVHATLTKFELSFDRLKDGQLVLPTLTHPLPRSALPCDSWFIITNTSLEDVRFEIGATLATEVADFIHVDVLSRFSNSPLRGNISLSPKGSIEVRVRAFPKEGSRLPNDTSFLCNPEGLTFGKLWITTKPSSGEDETAARFAEDIVLRGTIVEGSMFSLSTQRVEFKSLMETSDYDDDTGDEDNSAESGRYNELAAGSFAKQAMAQLTTQRASIVVTNLSTTFPLDFSILLEGPMEYPAAEIIKVSPLDSNNRGVVEAGQQLELWVELLNPGIVISEDVKLFIRNLNSNNGQQQRVLIGITSDNREPRKQIKKTMALEDELTDPHHRQNKLEDPATHTVGNSAQAVNSGPNDNDHETQAQPYLSLRGCKRIDNGDVYGGRYELDLGQQDMGSTIVTKKLVLGNPTYERVSYRIKTMSAVDKNWIKISRMDGTFEPRSEDSQDQQQQSAHTITLSFATHVRNVFSTYLLIENIDNPVDTKTIRITMEVVARQNMRRATKGLMESGNRVFDVYVNGVESKTTTLIEMKHLYYGSEYTARSMVVRNRETVPMEFTFKSDLAPTDMTEILFSTSRTSAKLFKTLTVPPENHVRVYIRFFPRPSAAIQAALDNGEYRDQNEMELKVVEIYINCRLVKDYHQVVTLHAECFLPALRVSWKDTQAFVGKLTKNNTASSALSSTTSSSSTSLSSSAATQSPSSSSTAPMSLPLTMTLMTTQDEEWTLTFDQEFRNLGIQNTLNLPLEYEIVNDTMYFNLEYPTEKRLVEPLGSHGIRVVPNIKALLKNAETFRREKYVQENITIYNRNRPLENYWLPLRLTFGNVSDFQLSSGYKSSYAFGQIEQHVVNFLSDFNSHAVLVTMNSSLGVSGGSGGGSTFVLPSPSSALENNGSGLSSSSSASGTSSSSSRNNSIIASAALSHALPGGPLASILNMDRNPFAHHPPHLQAQYLQQQQQILSIHPDILESRRKLIDLEFQYQYVVDQLVYYSTIKTGENFFQLASLLFCTLLGNRIFQIWSPALLRPLPGMTTAMGSSGSMILGGNNQSGNNSSGSANPKSTGGHGNSDGVNSSGSLWHGTGSSKSTNNNSSIAEASNTISQDLSIQSSSNSGSASAPSVLQALANGTAQQQSPQQSSYHPNKDSSLNSAGTNMPTLSTTTLVSSGANGNNGTNSNNGTITINNNNNSGNSSSNNNANQDESELKVWPEPLRKWVDALDYFISFFPYHTTHMDTLKALHRSLVLSPPKQE